MIDRLEELGLEARKLQDRALERREHAPVEQRLDRVHREIDRRKLVRAPSRVPWIWAASIAMAACIVLYVLRPASPLVALRGAEPIAADTWLESAEAKLPIAFSDGTSVVLAKSSRARLVRIDARGAEVALERGTVSLSVVKRPNAHWVVSAGPFQILVTGTRFDASWEPDHEVLRVVMQEGSVRVSGGCVVEPKSLSAGESSAFTCKPVAAAPKPPAPVVAKPASPPDKAGPKTATVAEEDDWYALFDEGRFKEAFAAAEAKGFSRLCASEGGGRVLALGNAARLAGNPARASEAFLAARQRFPGSPSAAIAGFHLGRIAFDGSHDYGAARRWFGAYLAEQPGGRFAEEALGRLMESEHRSGDRAAAELSANRYLARFPSGAHAALAQSLTQK